MTSTELFIWGFLLLCALACWCVLGYVEKQEQRPCAWCDKEQDIKRPSNVSHGICARHARKMQEEMELPDQDP